VSPVHFSGMHARRETAAVKEAFKNRFWFLSPFFGKVPVPFSEAVIARRVVRRE
jgi:hypothetical protein